MLLPAPPGAVEREKTMQKFETFATPRLTFQPQKLERLLQVTRPHLIDDVADALEHSTRKRWIQGAPRLHTRTTTTVQYPGRDLAVPHE